MTVGIQSTRQHTIFSILYEHILSNWVTAHLSYSVIHQIMQLSYQNSYIYTKVTCTVKMYEITLNKQFCLSRSHLLKQIMWQIITTDVNNMQIKMLYTKCFKFTCQTNAVNKIRINSSLHFLKYTKLKTKHHRKLLLYNRILKLYNQTSCQNNINMVTSFHTCQSII